jgi:hypothetical protein
MIVEKQGQDSQMLSCHLQELRRGYIIQKFRRGPIQDREVPGKYQYPLGGLRPLPLRDTDKEIIQGSKEVIPGRVLKYVSRSV